MRSYRWRSQAARAAAPAARCAAIHRTAIATSLPRAGLRAALLASVCLGALAILTPGVAYATDGTWIAPPPNPEEWTQGTNWSSSPTVPDGTATFTNNSATTSVTISGSASVETIQFTAAAPAYSFTNFNFFTINGAGIINNSASVPTFTNNGFISFDSGTAGNAAITNNGAVTFLNASSAGNSTIINFGGGSLVAFSNNSSATDATITTNSGAQTLFTTNSNGGNARFIANGGGSVDFSGTLGPSGNNQITAGSIEGAGTYSLGANQLTVGSNNLSTTVSGSIQDGGGAGGSSASLVKVGTGTLTLSGNNTYTGATTINAGTLAAASSTALPNQTALAVNLGATLAVTDGVAAQIGSLADGVSGGGGVQIGASDPTTLLTIAGNSSTTFSGTFSGPGSLELDSGSLTLTGASNGGNIGTIGGDLSLCNCDDGGLTISGGSLVVNGFAMGVTVTGGTLAVINGGTLQVGNPPATHDLLVASNMILSGAGSTVTVSGFTGVGIFGPGSLTISNGGVLNSQGGAEIDTFVPVLGVPTATVTGPGSTWNVGGSGLTVGGGSTSGPGRLIVSNGGVVNTSSLTIGDPCGCADGRVTITDGGVVNSFGFTGIGEASTLHLGIGGLAGAIITPAIDNRGRIVANFTDTLTLAAHISGSGTLSKAGAGTLILTGSNSYTGGTTITGGTLQLGNGGASGSIAGNVTNDGTFAINRSDTFAFGGVISGTGSFAQIGPGTTILTAANTYSGGTVINSGMLAVTADANLGAATGGLSFGGGTLQFLSGFTTNRAVTLNAGGGTFDTNGNNATLAGTISGSGPLTKIGAGVLTLSGSSTYSGATTVNSGTLQAGALNAFASASAFTIASGATLNLNGFNQTIGSLAGAGSVTLGSATLTTGTDNTSTTFSGTISGSGGLTKIGSGALTLSGANTYSGGTTITGGSLQLGNGGASGSIVGNVTNNGTFAINRSNTFTFGGVISGSGAFQQNGAGTTILTAANTYTGGTTITGGTLQLGNGGAGGSIVGNVTNSSTFAINRSDTFTFGGVISGSGALQQNGAGTTILTAANTYTGGTTINAGTLQLGNGGTSGSIAGDLVNNGTFAINRSDVFAFGGVISGTGAFQQNGTGTTILTANNTYTGGTALNAGTLAVGSNTALGTGALAFASGATLQAAANGLSLANAMTLSGADTVDTQTNALTLSGTISGSGGLTKIGSGVLTLSGANTYSGGTTLAAGTLRLASNQALGTGALTTTGSVVDYANGVTITNPIVLNSNTTQLQVTAGTATQAGVISELNGPRPMEKIGGGTLVLTANNTYSGPTTISAGTLIVNGSIANSAVTVNGGATLAGTGAVGAITITSGATFAPGAAATTGAMTVVGNLAFQSGALYLVHVNPSTASSTKVTAGGSATLSGTVQAVFASGRYATRSYTILSAAGGRSGTFSSLTTSNLPAGFTASLGYTATDATLNLTATLGRGPSDLGTGGLSINQSNVAEALNSFFNNGGALPPEFVSIFGLSGANLANALTLLSGEAATGAQQGAFQLTNQFLGIMLDPFVDGRSSVGGANGPALGFAPEREELPDDIALAYAKLLKAPPKPATFEQRWSVWGAGYGGSNRTSGDPAVVGSHDLSARTAGGAAGLDYRLAPNTVVGFALAGGGTNWSLAQGLGGGRSDAFQAGVYGTTRYGPAYVAAAFAYTNHWMSTDRFAFAGDHLTASFNASYSESDLTGSGFALAYNARTATDTRSELGGRFDRLLLLNPNAALTVRARVAWAHDWVSDPTLAALFQTLPGASFIVNGATPAKNSALTSAGAELRLANGVTLIGKFDGEFASHSSTYAGTGTVRYTW